MTRTFDAPRGLVWEALSKPEHMREWWGPRGFTMPVCEIDLRVGGAYRFVPKGPDGAEYGFRGEYREIVPPERIGWTFEFEGMPGSISVDTMTLTEEDGKTTITSFRLRLGGAARRGAPVGDGDRRRRDLRPARRAPGEDAGEHRVADAVNHSKPYGRESDP